MLILTLASIYMLVIGPQRYKVFLTEQLYSFNSLYRMLFVLVYASFAAGVLIHVWGRREINYIHIMQIEYKDRMNPF